MKVMLLVQVTPEDIAAAEGLHPMDWWQWPLKRALEGLTHVDVDIDGGDGDGNCIATIGGRDDVTLVVGLGAIASTWLDARFEARANDLKSEPFDFELELPDWLCALVDGAVGATIDKVIDDEMAACRICGCTDEYACAGGCRWVADPESLGYLCSACLPDIAGGGQ